MDLAVTAGHGVGLAGQAVSDSSGSMDRRVVRLPRWPVSEAQTGLGTGINPPRVFSHEMTIEANAAIAELLTGNRNPRETLAQLTPPEWFISMHVHGVNDYGMHIVDSDYEDRSEVTTFLSEVTTTASLDDPAHCIAYNEGDSLEPIADLMDGVPDRQVESEPLEPMGARGVDVSFFEGADYNPCVVIDEAGMSSWCPKSWDGLVPEDARDRCGILPSSTQEAGRVIHKYMQVYHGFRMNELGAGDDDHTNILAEEIVLVIKDQGWQHWKKRLSECLHIR